MRVYLRLGLYFSKAYHHFMNYRTFLHYSCRSLEISHSIISITLWDSSRSNIWLKLSIVCSSSFVYHECHLFSDHLEGPAPHIENHWKKVKLTPFHSTLTSYISKILKHCCSDNVHNNPINLVLKVINITGTSFQLNQYFHFWAFKFNLPIKLCRSCSCT